MVSLVLVSAAALINDANRVLIAQRPADKTYPGKWELPGGKIETGETPQIALQRELREELAIAVAPDQMEEFTFISYTYPEFAVLIPVYVCRRWTGVMCAMENQCLAWVSADEASSYDCLPSNTDVMRRLASFLRD